MEKKYQIWDDGYSPIVFVMLNENFSNELSTCVSRDILVHSKKIVKKFGRSYVIINFSSLEFSHDNVELMKTLKRNLMLSHIKAIAIISLCKKKFNINLTEEEQNTSARCFDSFEQALGFINQLIETSAADLIHV